MRMRSLLLGWTAALALSLCACSQGKGEPCQVDRDCADGLVCDRGKQERSTCEPPGSNDDDDGTDEATDSSAVADAAQGDAAEPDEDAGN